MRTLRTVLFFAIFLLSRTMVGQIKDSSIASDSELANKDVVAMIPWDVTNSDLIELICVVRNTPDKGPSGAVRSERVLDIYSKNRSSSSANLVYSSDKTSDLLLNIYPLGEVNGRLMTTWTGGSAHNIVVFAYTHGRVQKVLDVYSRGMPEVIINGKEQEFILVTEMDMANGKWKRNSNATTDVYKWNGSTYTRLGRVPWNRRLQCVSTESCSNLR